MEKKTQERLEQIAPNLQQFLQLHPDEQRWLYPLLGKAEKRAITILEECEGHYLTYTEIAKLTDTHPNTVKQILYALENGGIIFYNGTTKKYTTPNGGRNRKLVKLE